MYRTDIHFLTFISFDSYCFHPGANSMTTVFVLVLLLVCKLWLARLKNWFLPELSCPRHRQTVKLDTVKNMSVE